MKEIKPLTALRGIFALWVVGYHLHALRFAPTPDPFGVLGRGYLAVDFFFLLSGFVLAGAYGTRLFSVQDYCRYVVKRAGRMFPLHVLILSVIAGVAIIHDAPYCVSQFVQEALLLHRWPLMPAPVHAINGPAWSISTEWLTNLLLPVLAILALPTGRWRPLGSLAVAGALIVAIGATNQGSLDIASANSPAPFLRCLSEFTIGMLLFRWRSLADHLTGWRSAAVCLATVAALFTGVSDVLLVMLLAATIMALSNATGVVSRALSWRYLHGLGTISFSVYLIHEPVLFTVRHFAQMLPFDPAGQTLAFVFATVGATLVVSFLTYVAIEQPARDASKRLAEHHVFGSISTKVPTA
jgi:peptidoglycan/LPS O-acetylase OafA/YrhL